MPNRLRCAMLALGLWTGLATATGLPENLRVPGGVAVLPLGAEENAPPLVSFGGKRALVMRDPAQSRWVAVVGIPLGTKPGEARIEVRNAAGKPAKPLGFKIEDKEYASQHLTIKNQRQVNPNPADLERIAREKQRVNAVKATWSEGRVPDFPFSLPVDGRLSSPFGLRRFFNEQPRKPHSGLDIAAPEGTPIRAPADGVVADRGEFFFNGNVVYLDHGQGVISSYSHMQQIQVRPGQAVKRGEVIGKVGQTGRVTGPHLHWDIMLNQTSVDPSLMIASPAPQTREPATDPM